MSHGTSPSIIKRAMGGWMSMSAISIQVGGPKNVVLVNANPKRSVSRVRVV